MDLATIEVDRATAIRAFQAYRAEARARHLAEDHQLMAGYRELARGNRLIDLRRTMREAGLIEVTSASRTVRSRTLKLPRLAICRADALRCQCRVGWDGEVWFASDTTPGTPRIRAGVTDDYVVFGSGTLESDGLATGRAVVPIIPPQLRPTHPHAYHILWEAEWEPRAPRDPALLKHVGGDLWAAIAVWDLTELERAVVMGRMR